MNRVKCVNAAMELWERNPDRALTRTPPVSLGRSMHRSTPSDWVWHEFVILPKPQGFGGPPKS